MALTIDGSTGDAFSEVSIASTSGLTTTKLNDLIVVCIFNENIFTATSNTVTSVTASGLTFTKHSQFNYIIPDVFGGGFTNMEWWSASSSAALTSKVINVNWSGVFNNGFIYTFGVNLDGVNVPLWDTNTLPKTAVNPNVGTVNPSVTVSTTDTNPMVIQLYGSSGTSVIPIPGVGYTNINSGIQHSDGNGNAVGALAQRTYSSALVNTTVAMGASDFYPQWLYMVDAIQGNVPGIPPVPPSPLPPPTVGPYNLTFSEERDNILWEDWNSANTPTNYTSTFTTGYALHGDAIRKWGPEYVFVYSDEKPVT